MTLTIVLRYARFGVGAWQYVTIQYARNHHIKNIEGGLELLVDYLKSFKLGIRKTKKKVDYQ